MQRWIRLHIHNNPIIKIWDYVLIKRFICNKNDCTAWFLQIHVAQFKFYCNLRRTIKRWTNISTIIDPNPIHRLPFINIAKIISSDRLLIKIDAGLKNDSIHYRTTSAMWTGVSIFIRPRMNRSRSTWTDSAYSRFPYPMKWGYRIRAKSPRMSFPLLFLYTDSNTNTCPARYRHSNLHLPH